MYVNYGKPSDFRVDNRTMEYRVVGGNLLRHPTLTLGIITVGAIVVQDIVDKFNSLTHGFKDLHWAMNDRRLLDVYPNITNTINTYNLICSPTDYNARSVLGNIIEDIRLMSKYKENMQQTENFFTSLVENYQYSNNIEENWGSVHHGKSSCFY
jgi:ribonuclease HIII